MSTDKTPKVENPRAPFDGELPELQAGCEWDTVEISGWDFAIQVAKDQTGIEALTGGNETLAARMFNRALRIDVPAILDARPKMKEAKVKADAARELQKLILAFDVSAIRPRAARAPKTVAVPDKPQFSQAEVLALLASHGVKTVVA